MFFNKYKGPERRGYMRLDADCAVDYIKLSDNLKPAYNIVDDGYSKDISASGIRFTAQEKLTIGSFLELRIKIPTINKFLAATGKVIRCDIGAKNNFEIAVSFIWINKRDKELIDKYVKNKRLEELRSEIKE